MVALIPFLGWALGVQYTNKKFTKKGPTHVLQQQADVDESTTNSADVGDENGANDDHDEDEDGTGNGNANGSSMLVDEDSDDEVTFNQSSVHQVWPIMKLYSVCFFCKKKSSII